MPLDVITINAICSELKELLLDKKILKIHQPESDEITFSVKTERGIRTLVMSANASFPRLHITASKKENPISAMPFCMLARKHLSGGFISDLSLINGDRIVRLVINSKNELNDNVKFFLYIELMGRYSNIILTDESNTILDAVKRVAFEQNAKRFILPGLTYSPMSSSKPSPADSAAVSAIFSGQENVDYNFILDNIGGFSVETAKELLLRFPSKPRDGVDAFFNIFGSDIYAPGIAYKRDGSIKDFYVTEYKSVDADFKSFPTINEAMDTFYNVHDSVYRKKNNTKKLNQLLKRLLTRIAKRTEDNNAKLNECENMKTYQQYGELIISNLYKLKKGDTALTCENYYTMETVTVPLDPLLFPQQNAQAYFKKYTKLKRAKEIASTQLELLSSQKKYLDSIAVAIENSSTKQEYDEILNELNALGAMKKANPTAKKSKVKASKIESINIDGYEVLIGKNNLQNAELTFNIAKSSDLWLHTKAYHGSHTVIKGTNIPPEVIEKAARICAYYSGGKNLPKVEVDYTLRKFVKKISSSTPGMVTYTNYKTILVEPKLI